MKCTNLLIPTGCKVAVMGFGITGRAAVEYALACGAEVRVSDSRDIEQLAESVSFFRDCGVLFSDGGHSLEFLQQADIVLLSPGISYNDPMVQLVRGRGIPVYGELAVLAEIIKESRVIAVTGSNGKTTVTSLIGWVLQQSGYDIFVGGNIGVPLYEYCLQVCRKEIAPADIIVLEVSSFQLECCGNFAPDIGVLLNITPDHLDRHVSMAGYIATKMNMFFGQSKEQMGIINGDDINCQNLRADFHGQFHSFGRKFFNDAIIVDDTITLVEEGKREQLDFTGDAVRGFAGENFAAAALALRAAGLDFTEVESGFRSFQRPPHRMEEVAEIDGILYINDSKATNTGAVIGALQRMNRSVVLIAGGRDKGEDYTLLRDAVKRHTKAVIVIGEAANDIAAALDGCALVIYAETMHDAIVTGSKMAESGDVVLLSPACASFDMFASYSERGRIFRECVTGLREGS